MLTPDQIEALRIKAGQITDPVVEFLISDIASRIAEAGQMTSTAAYQVWRAQQLGLSQRQLKKELRKRLKVSHRELRKLMTQAAEVGYDYDISRFPFVQAVPFAENETLQKLVNAAIEQADEGLTNLTQTMGFVTHDGIVTELTEAYQKSCDFAFEKVFTGAQDYQSVIREATRGLAEKGILTLDYESGIHRSLEAAVRGNMMGGLGLMQEQISQQNHDELGCDGWEISAHAASAPDHEPYQGKQYPDAAYTRLNNSLLRRIGTLNCGHSAMPIIMGINEPQYTAEELEQFREDNEKGVEYNGKHYTQYEATQRQRGLERSIRKKKRQILIDEKLGDKEQLPIDQTRYVILRDEYARFSKAAGLRTQQERMNVPGFGPKQDRAAEKQRNQPTSNFGSNDGVQDMTPSIEQPGADPLSIEAINERGTRNLIDAYDRRRLHFGLNMVPGEEILSSPLNSFVQDYTGVSAETANIFETTIAKLSEKYYTGLTRVEVGDPKKFFGSGIFASVTPMPTVGANTLTINPLKAKDYSALTQRIKELSQKGFCVKIPDAHLGEYVATHEFAHTLINMKVDSYKNYVGIDANYFTRAKKEIEGLYDKYISDLSGLEARYKEVEKKFFFVSNQTELAAVQREFSQVKSELTGKRISRYSLENADEFMAECFTDCMIGENPSEYSKLVLEVLNRYFGR